MAGARKHAQQNATDRGQYRFRLNAEAHCLADMSLTRLASTPTMTEPTDIT